MTFVVPMWNTFRSVGTKDGLIGTMANVMLNERVVIPKGQAFIQAIQKPQAPQCYNRTGAELVHERCTRYQESTGLSQRICVQLTTGYRSSTNGGSGVMLMSTINRNQEECYQHANVPCALKSPSQLGLNSHRSNAFSSSSASARSAVIEFVYNTLGAHFTTLSHLPIYNRQSITSYQITRF